VIKEYQFGTSSDKVLLIQECPNSKAVTVLIRGGSKTICDEAKRCLFDAICVVRNMIRSNLVVPGGGAIELAMSIEVAKEADKIEGIEQYAVRAYADALEEIPMTLADNSGFNSIDYLQKMKQK
jgi:T-complex protein 1 subunit epsilon